MPAVNLNSDDSPEGASRYEGLDLTSECSNLPNVNRDSAPARSNNPSQKFLKDVQVVFGCCKVHWRFPIPADVLTGIKESWTVHCPRCGTKVEIP